ncbi:MAG: Holliday junction resolvase RuvX [Polyangiaceae bacterium]|nr:Holliday junction resolvase RuvX [Polyangiaceae bacterium]
MRAAAIDLGRVRVGLAVSDELGAIAHTRPCLPGHDAGRLVASLSRIAGDEGIDLFIVGLPRTLRGHEGPAARQARAFAQRLSRDTGIRVELMDERWTTKEAYSRLAEQGLDQKKARSRVDSAAAAIMLQAWLDRARCNDAGDHDDDERFAP